jgi:uncharacterized protein with PQ loop repeat
MSLGLKHIEKRKKAGRFGTLLDYAIYTAAVVAPFALVPQVLQLYTTHDASSLSLVTWTILGCMNCVWLAYGLYHREAPITITNTLLAIFNFTTVAGILLYR